MEKIYNFSNLSRARFRQAVKSADSSIFNDVLAFLEDDPCTFGSGYIKQIAWKYIKRYELSSQHIARLENAALQYLYRPMTPEFKLMCQTMCRVASADFWLRVQAQLNSDNTLVRLNASCLFPYSRGIVEGEKVRLAWKHRKQHPRKALEVFYNGSELLSLMKAPENWRNGEPVYREPNHAEMPILYYDPSHDSEIASLDIAASDTKLVLNKLDKVLSTGTLNVFTLNTWIYALYLLSQINDADAVPIIIRFMQDKIAYKFESPKKALILMSCLKVLRYYDTVDAQTAIEAHKEADQLFSRHYQGNNGWLLTYSVRKD